MAIIVAWDKEDVDKRYQPVTISTTPTTESEPAAKPFSQVISETYTSSYGYSFQYSSNLLPMSKNDFNKLSKTIGISPKDVSVFEQGLQTNEPNQADRTTLLIEDIFEDNIDNFRQDLPPDSENEPSLLPDKMELIQTAVADVYDLSHPKGYQLAATVWLPYLLHEPSTPTGKGVAIDLVCQSSVQGRCAAVVQQALSSLRLAH